MSEYVYEIMCDSCGCLLGFWRYAGPFHGSMRCERCKDKPEDDGPKQRSHLTVASRGLEREP